MDYIDARNCRCDFCRRENPYQFLRDGRQFDGPIITDEDFRRMSHRYVLKQMVKSAHSKLTSAKDHTLKVWALVKTRTKAESEAGQQLERQDVDEMLLETYRRFAPPSTQALLDDAN
jgi:hypothetical protein